MSEHPAARLSLRIDFPNGERLGPGKVRLLEAIAAEGSISAAGRSMGMSYRRAWLLVDAMNAMFETPLIGSHQGGTGGGGASLTPLGLDVVRLYRQIEAETRAHAAGTIAALTARMVPKPEER
jgi:molybdate transport system regulatory protein